MDETSATPAPGAQAPHRSGFAIVLLIALTVLSLPVIPWTARAAFNNECRSKGGDLDCVAPNVDEWWWVAAVGAKGGDCATGPGSPTGHHCVERSEALQLAEQAFRNTVAECSVQYSQQGETIQQFLGRDFVKSQYFDLTYTVRDDEVPPCQTTIHSPSASAFTQASAYRPVWCPPTFSPDSAKNACVRPRCEVCRVGNPVQCTNGEKFETEVDIAAGPGSLLEFRRYYASSGFYTSASADRSEKVLGTQWRHSWQREVVVEQTTSPTPRSVAYVARPDGDYRHFVLSGTSWTGRTDKPETLEQMTGSGPAAWRYTTADNAVELYDAAGKLLSIETPDGRSVQLAYSDASTPLTTAPLPGLLTEVVDQAGRAISLRYNARAMLVSVEDPTGAVYGYRYDTSETVPVFVDYPDASVREYRYGETGFVAGSNPTDTLLTGIIDENGQRFGSYKYDSSQRAYEEWHGGSGLVDRLVLNYSGTPTSTAGSTRMTDALGATRKVYFSAINGIIKETSTYRCGNNDPTCAQTSAQNSKTYDANGNLDLAKDFRGTTTDYDYNTRGLEIRRRENATLPALSCPDGTSSNSSNYSSTCTNGTCWKTSEFPGSLSAASMGWNGWHYSCRLPPGPEAPARTTETDWHANFHLPTERRLRNAASTLEAKTQWAYNSRGQVVARCEIDITDATAMAYTCSDTVAPSAGAKVRRWTYSYCEATDVAAPNSTCPILGFAKTVNGPRAVTDPGMNGLDDITTYAYYPSTDESGCGTVGGVCHRKGDLHTVTNALGHVVETVAYDKNGRAVRSRDPNGTITDVTYNSRGWLLSSTVRALASGANNADDATTTFAYDNIGQVTRVTQPDGAYLNYSYDDAHRLTDIVDNLSNRIHYTLDAAGNRIKEETFDASYNPATPGVGLKRVLSREYNALSRLVRTLNASNAATRDSTPYDTSPLADGYDANGNSVQFKDGLNVQTQQSYDALNRLVKTIKDYAGINTQTGNATIEYSYDVRQNITLVKDPDALTTTYRFDGLSDLVEINSPDTGKTSFSYDSAGNRISRTDNRNVKATYIYDSFNRPYSINYPTSTLDVVFKYDQYDPATLCPGLSAVGRLTQRVDDSGTTTFCYDRRGNVTQKTTKKNGVNFYTHFDYDKSDRVSAVTYPNGGQASYFYDSVGNTKIITWRDPNSVTATPLVTSTEHYPFGPLRKIDFANGRTQNRIYDEDYRIDLVQPMGNTGLNVDFDLDIKGNIIGLSSSFASQTFLRGYEYDKLNRLVLIRDPGGQILESFSYNKTGDRTQRQLVGGPVEQYEYLAGTHKLISVSGASRSYDGNGNTISANGGLSMSYDDRNRLATSTTATQSTNYCYTARGERSSKSSTKNGNNVTDQYIYNESSQLIFEQTTDSGSSSISGSSYVYLDGFLVALIRGHQIIYVETDHLGTPRVAISPETNEELWRWEISDSSFGDNPAFSSTGTKINLRFPGQYYDEETGLSYNYFRDYEPSTGRYVESDPIGLRGGLSTYAYVDSSPLNSTDFYGRARDHRGYWRPNSEHRNEKDKNKKKPKYFPPLKPEPENEMDWSSWADENFKIVCGKVTCCINPWVECRIEPCTDLQFMGGYPSLNAVASGAYNSGGRTCECYNWRFNDMIEDPSTDGPPTLNGGQVLDMIGDFQKARTNRATRGGSR